MDRTASALFAVQLGAALSGTETATEEATPLHAGAGEPDWPAGGEPTVHLPFVKFQPTVPEGLALSSYLRSRAEPLLSVGCH